MLRDGGPSGQGLYVLGPLAFGASIGLQIMMAAFMRFGFARGQPFFLELTPYGRSISAPEYDLPIFVGGLALSLLSSLAAAAWWSREIARAPAAERERAMRVSALLLGGLGVTSLLAFAGLISSYWFTHSFYKAMLPIDDRWTRLDVYRLLIPAAMAASCALWDVKFGRRRAADARGDRLAPLRKVGVAVFPIFVALVVGMPPGSWTQLAGASFIWDRCHHLNFFVVGPALSFAHGQAFGTEIYSQYGIGWPWLLSMVSGLFPVGTYAAFLGMAGVYGCLYYSSWFFTLWLALRNAVWAAIGVALAISWQMFGGLTSDEVIWWYPSSTMLRHPFDVAFFLALVLHQRSARLRWIALAGLAAGLGVVFETETGIYLFVAFGLWWLLDSIVPIPRGSPAERKTSFAVLSAFYLTAVAVLLPLLLYASRGTLFSRAFVSGWLEPLIGYSVWGFGAMPISINPDAALWLFLAMNAIYLAVISYAVHGSFRGHARSEDVLLATIAAYGLALLLLFVGRSHPFNLAHASVPFAIALTMLLYRVDRALRRWLPHSGVAHVVCAGVLALLLTNASFLNYPSLLASVFRDPPDPGLSLTSDPVDLSGFRPVTKPFVTYFREIAAAIRSIRSSEHEIAIIDGDDTLFYYASGVAPWSRYASLYTMMVSYRSLDALKSEFAERPPRHVVMRMKPEPIHFDYLWYPIHQILESRYAVSQTVQNFEIWTLRDEAPAR